MSVYVDKMFNHGKRIGRAGPEWAHLLADSKEELHTFAVSIGLKRAWFQGDHYDIGSWRVYTAALDRGAIQLQGREWIDCVVRIRRSFRETDT